MEFLIADSFTDSLAELTRDEQKGSSSFSEMCSVLLANGEFFEIPYEIHLIFFKSFSTALNSRSPVTNSAFLIFAKAAAKQSA